MSTTTLNRERLRGGQLLSFRVFAALLVFLTVFGFSKKSVAQSVVDNSLSFTGITSSSTAPQTNSYAGVKYSGDPAYANLAYLGLVRTDGTVQRPNPSLGTYDLTGTSQLSLSGGSLVVYPGTDFTGAALSVTSASVSYRIYKSGTSPTNSANPYTTTALTQNSTSYNGRANNYYFTGSSNFNLLAGLTIGGVYVVESFYAYVTSDGVSHQDPAGTYQAEFTLTAPPAPTIVGTKVYIAPNGSASNTAYNVNPPVSPSFQGANLGSSYDVNTGILTLNGGSATTTEAGSNTITNVTLYYRVHLAGTAGGAFNFINLPLTSSSSGTKTFATATANINLINNLPATGNYLLDVYYFASGTNSSNPTNPVAFTVTDNNQGNFYTANFTVTGTPIITTVWVGGIDDDWFDARNWTKGVPTRDTNAEIANLGSSVNRAYPNIYGDTIYTYRFPARTTSAGTVAAHDTVIDNTGKIAEARNLTMDGNTQADRSILRIIAGRLRVLGDFFNIYDSFIARAFTTVEFAGGNQVISNGTFFGVEISGSGVKALSGVMTVNREITFTNGLLTTDITRPTQSVVYLGDRAAINNNQGAQLVGERDDSYLRGFVRTSRANTTIGDVYSYGNIGMDLVWSGNNPGAVDITRNTVEVYAPASSSKSSIRRIFGVRPTNPATNGGGLNADLTFHYLDSETKNLGTDGSVNINEANLGLFVSTNSGNTFTNLGRTTFDTNTNQLTRTGVTIFATFTLGDLTNPLPVKLVAFDAKRQGNNTLVTWATADETNNAGFEVQVSSDAKTFRKLSFVNSYSNNSTAYQTYSYTDTEAGKSGVRYYRLRQVDLDGKESYSPVRAVSFATVAAGTVAINVYPNPSATADQTTLVVQSPVAGQGRLQVMDLTGRTIINRDITTVAGVTEMAVPVSSELSAGIYLVKVTMPSGEVKTTRLQKQ